MSQWADLASISGFFLAVGGFTVTIIGVFRARSAAVQAKDAVDKARTEIFRSSAMLELSEATAALQEIKRLQRDKDWHQLLGKYTALRSLLIAIRAGRPNLDDSHRAAIQDALVQVRSIEAKVEKALEGGSDPGSAKLNLIIGDQLDRLSAVIGELRSKQDG